MTKADEGKEGPLQGQSQARQLARRIIEARRSEQSEGDTPARSAAAASERLFHDLSRWVGVDGCYALFFRALSQARTDYPALAHIQIHARSQPQIDGVAESIMACGDPATAEGIEFMLERLVELLGRLIGDDMATKLLERNLTASERVDPGSDARREEA